MRDVAAAAREGLAEVRAAVSGVTGASLSHEIASSQAALAAAGIACQIAGDADRIDPGTSAVLAKALREAVTNVIRHSGAKTCRIALVQRPERLELQVSDDGDGAAVRPGGGISGLRSRLADEGRSNKEIARQLDLSPGTVRNYLSDASAKLYASSRIEAGRIARERGWL